MKPLSQLPARPPRRRRATPRYPRTLMVAVGAAAIAWLGAACGGAALEYEPEVSEGGADPGWDDDLGGGDAQGGEEAQGGAGGDEATAGSGGF